MLHPTSEEFVQAWNLDIDTSGLNRTQLIEAIDNSLSLSNRGSPAAIRSMSHFNEVVRQLQIRARRSDTFPDLKLRVAEKLQKIFGKKGITKGVRIEYLLTSPWNRGLRARVLDTGITWGYYLPYITLHMEGKSSPHIYYAHGVAMYTKKVA